MRFVVAGLVLLLMVLHQDFWNWRTAYPLVLGFIPVGLAWHAGISISAAIVWGLAVRFCWPHEAEVLDTLDAPPPNGGRAGAGSEPHRDREGAGQQLNRDREGAGSNRGSAGGPSRAEGGHA